MPGWQKLPQGLEASGEAWKASWVSGRSEASQLACSLTPESLDLPRYAGRRHSMGIMHSARRGWLSICLYLLIRACVRGEQVTVCWSPRVSTSDGSPGCLVDYMNEYECPKYLKFFGSFVDNSKVRPDLSPI